MGSCLKRSSKVHPAISGERDVERDCSRIELTGKSDGGPALHGNQRLEPFAVGQVHQNPGEHGVVVDNEENCIAGLMLLRSSSTAIWGGASKGPIPSIAASIPFAAIFERLDMRTRRTEKSCSRSTGFAT